MEQKIGEKPVELDHNSGGDGEPDRGEHRSGGKELFHDLKAEVKGTEKAVKSCVERCTQRGETVILLSASVSLPEVSSLKAARGQVAEAIVAFRATGTSIWISCMVASLRFATSCK